MIKDTSEIAVSVSMRKMLFFIFLPALVWAQNPQGSQPRVQEGRFTFDTDKPFKLLTLDEKTDEPLPKKKKKPKPKVFYGVKTKKAFTRKGFGNKSTVELFYVLKNRKENSTGFARDIYWYDYKRREIRKTATFDPKRGVLLHGPYKKSTGSNVLEEGIFYKGRKHARWMRYNTKDLVEDKAKYYKGWPKDSYVTYYDPLERKYLKEVVPIEYGEKDGYYYMLHENGSVAVVGEYQWNEKVGDWIENYPNGKRKRIITYQKEPFTKGFTSYIRKEWDEKGKEVYSK